MSRGYLLLKEDLTTDVLNIDFNEMCKLVSNSFCGYKSFKLNGIAFDMYFNDNFLSEVNRLNVRASKLVNEDIRGNAFIAVREFDSDGESSSEKLTQEQIDLILENVNIDRFAEEQITNAVKEAVEIINSSTILKHQFNSGRNITEKEIMDFMDFEKQVSIHKGCLDFREPSLINAYKVKLVNKEGKSHNSDVVICCDGCYEYLFELSKFMNK